MRIGLTSSNSNNHCNNSSVDSIVQSFVMFPPTQDQNCAGNGYYQPQPQQQPQQLTTYNSYYPYSQYHFSSNIFGYQSPNSQISSSVMGPPPVPSSTQFSLTSPAYPPLKFLASPYDTKTKPAYPPIKQFPFIPYMPHQVSFVQSPTYSDSQAENAKYSQGQNTTQYTSTFNETTPRGYVNAKPPTSNYQNTTTSLYPPSSPAPFPSPSTNTPYPPTSSFSSYNQTSYSSSSSSSQSREAAFNQVTVNTNNPNPPANVNPTATPTYPPTFLPPPYPPPPQYPHNTNNNTNTIQPGYNPPYSNLVNNPNTNTSTSFTYSPSQSFIPNSLNYSQSYSNSSVVPPASPLNYSSPSFSYPSSNSSIPSYADSQSTSFNNPSPSQTSPTPYNTGAYSNQANTPIPNQVSSLNASSHLNTPSQASIPAAPPNPITNPSQPPTISPAPYRFENTFTSMITDLSRLIDSEKDKPTDNNCSNTNNESPCGKSESGGKSKTNSECTPGECDEEDDGKCLICFDLIANSACAPCGHLALCFSCAEAVVKKSNKCPICNSQIASIVRIFKVV
eukprot:TRINITY_DN946_c0_g5_i1.p1 TRINITY_DN946_c0_g5~~TRINITY_DN946_c0_g5_i1.p1  ORF type:complete len:560 (+),score=121.93 TRINITY_DN946_c0_g5_i1:75-1754(+)